MPGGFTNPFEYREMMYKMFWLGEMPSGGEGAADAKVQRANNDIKKARERKLAGERPERMAASTEREMAAMAAQIAAAKARREAAGD